VTVFHVDGGPEPTEGNVRMVEKEVSIARRTSGNPSEVEVEMALRGDTDGTVRVEFLLIPGDGLAFLQDGELRTSLVTDVRVSASRAVKSSHRLKLQRRHGTGTNDRLVPLVVRFDPEGGMDPDEVYREIPPPAR